MAVAVAVGGSHQYIYRPIIDGSDFRTKCTLHFRCRFTPTFAVFRPNPSSFAHRHSGVSRLECDWGLKLFLLPKIDLCFPKASIAPHVPSFACRFAAPVPIPLHPAAERRENKRLRPRLFQTERRNRARRAPKAVPPSRCDEATGPVRHSLTTNRAWAIKFFATQR